MKNIKTKWSNKSIKSRLGWLLCGITSFIFAAFVFLYQPAPVVADYAPDEFVTTWKTDNPGNSGDNQITIPTTGGGYSYNVAWEEVGNPGNSGTNGPYAGSATITFPSTGVYEVRVTGSFPRIYFDGGTGGDRRKILTVEQWGNNQWASMAGAFFGTINLTVPAIDAPNLSSVTTTSRMLLDAHSFNSNINHWDVSNVTNMSSMFGNTYSFNQPLNDWDVSSVTNMSNMFGKAMNTYGLSTGDPTVFNQPLNNWDTSNVTDMSDMFSGASSFNQNINNWNTSSVVNMLQVFASATAFNQPLNNWDTSNVTDMTGLFSGASSFNQNINNWNTSSVLSMDAMFYSATAFNQPLNKWNTSSVLYMGYMFYYASSFNQPLNAWDVSNVTDMMSMLRHTISFSQPIYHWDISNVTDMRFMLYEAGLSTYDYDTALIAWSQLSLQNNVTFAAGSSNYCHATAARASIIADFNWTITDDGENCSNAGPAPNEFVTTWKTDNPGESNDNQITIPTYSSEVYNYNVAWEEVGNPSSSGMAGPFVGDATITFPSAGIYEVRIIGDFPRIFFAQSNDPQKILTVERWGNNQWNSMSQAFYGTSNLQVPATDAPNLSSVTDMSGMFFYNTSLNQSINHWDVSNVTNMSGMFNVATAFNQPLNNWDTSNVTDMTGLFSGASSFNQNINNWNTSSVLSMDAMFYSATAFNQPLNNWNVSNVTNALGMFYNAAVFDQPLDGWDTSSITDTELMFYGATAFDQSLADWDVSQMTQASSMLAGTALSSENYDDTLIGWSSQSLQNNVVFDASPATYCAAATQRQHIIGTYNWTISDGGEDCPPEPFITTWKTDNPGTSNSNQITIPVGPFSGCDYNYNVEWEEVGNTSNSGSAGPFTEEATITFPASGVYEIRITGDFPCIYFNDTGDKEKILTVEQWGSNQWAVMEGAFYGASNLQIPAADAPNLSSVDSMAGMFRDSTAFNSNINHWDVSGVVSTHAMFQGATSFNQPLGDWDVSSITDMSYMFQGATSFNQPIGNWDMSSVEHMRAVFAGATSFNQPIGNWDMSSVTDLGHLFAGATSFNQPLNDWDVSGVTDMEYVFSHSSFNRPLNDWNVSNVTDMQGMFHFTEFNQPIGNWDVSNVVNMQSMFQNTPFNQELSLWDTSSVTRMESMFAGFYESNPFNQPIGNWNVSNVTDMSSMFYLATSFDQDTSAWDTSSVTSMNRMFQGATSFNQTLGAWDVSGVSNMEEMLSMTGLSTSNYDTTLIGWSSQALQSGVQLGVSSWYCDAADERQHIIDTFGWTINDLGIICASDLPAVATGDPVEILNDWAGVSIEIFSDGGGQITDHGVEYGETTDYGSQSSYGWGSVGTTSIYLSNLDCGVTYHYRAYATNSEGTVYGEDKTFTTGPSCPISFDVSLSGEVVGEDPIEASDDTTYRLHITNHGDGAFAEAQVLVNIPEEASYTGVTLVDRTGYDVSCMDLGPTSGMADATGTDPGLWVGYTGNTLMCQLQLNDGDPVLSDEDIVIDISLTAIQDFVESTVFHALLMGNEYEADYDAINAVLSASPADPIYSHAINNITETVYEANGSGSNLGAFITTWKTDNPGSSNDNQIIIPTHPDETYNYTVDWEEVGNPDNNGTAGPFTGDGTITFPSAGTYKVSITGDFPSIYFNNSGDREKIMTVEQWGANQWTSMSRAFYGASNLQIPATDAPDLSGVGSTGYMFADATNFNSDIGHWDVSSVTDMSAMFSSAISFNQPLSDWDVSSVVSMNQMFAAATSFNQPIGDWDTSALGDLYATFMYATSFNQPLNNWDVSNVELAYYTFMGATSFNQPLDTWDTSSIEYMTMMFLGASSFDQSLESWDVSNVADISMMFGSMDFLIEANMEGIPYEDWPQEIKDLYGLPASGLSTAHYDATLIAWSALTLQDDVTFDAGTSTYCDAANQRQSIIDTFGWTINDSGENCDDEEEPTDPETPGGPNPPTRPTTPPSTVTPDEPPVVPGEGEQPGVVEERTPEDDDEAAVVRDEDGLESEPGGGSTTPRRPGGEAVQGRENFVARTLDGVASFFGVSPIAVAQAFPWLLIILLLLLALVTAIKVIQQLFVIAKTRKLVARQVLLNHEKKSLISLATHYLRTPLTILSSGIEMLPTESTARQAISKATAGLKVTVDKLIGQIETNKNLVNLAEPSKPLHRRTSLLQPAIFVPTLLTLGLVLGANILVAVATTFDPGWQHIGAQIVGVLIVGGLFYVAYDHHRQKKTLQAYEQQLLKHEEGLDVARNQFVKGMADTLVPAVVAVDTVVPAGLPEDATKFLKEGLRQLEHTVGDFILIGQLEKQVLQQRATSVAVRDTVNRAQQQLKQSDAQLSVNIPADTTVHQPQFLLHKVFGSLIDNAVAHNKPNTPAEVTSKQGKAITAIEVTDYGEGIPEDKLSLLFKPLSRVQTAEDFTHQGIGLSLYVSRLIMHYLGGDISAASKVGKGTTMQVKVPNQMEV